MHAVVNLDKPKGITSQDAVTRVKKIFGAKKAGHAGTLDPLATGVLLVCLNEATKVAGYLSGLPKEYLTTIKLGERTDTYDAEGKVTEVRDFRLVMEEDILQALERFRGEIEQSPPMYSAIKVAGKPLYKLARKGITIERQMRKVTVYEIRLEGFEPPYADIYVSCSTGTYVRSLAEDIGLLLGCGAHVTELRRLSIGGFRAADSATLQELPDKPGAISSIDSALGHLDELVLSERDYLLASHGTAIVCKNAVNGGILRLKRPDGGLFAIGIAREDTVRVERILHLTS